MPRIHYKSFRGITALARELRNNPTPYEEIVWEILRKRRICGYKFLRQHPIIYRADNNWVDFCMVDFYCAELRLVIEVDGAIHDIQKEYDAERDSWLFNKGKTFARIKNEEVTDFQYLSKKIKKNIDKSICEGV
jgi:very-short-patch-repair endonuclease